MEKAKIVCENFNLDYLRNEFVSLRIDDVDSSKGHYEFIKLVIKTDFIDLSFSIQGLTEFEKTYLKNIILENDYVVYKRKRQYTQRDTGKLIEYDVVCVSRAEPNVCNLEHFIIKLDSTTKQVACSLLDYFKE